MVNWIWLVECWKQVVKLFSQQVLHLFCRSSAVSKEYTLTFSLMFDLLFSHVMLGNSILKYSAREWREKRA